jgi:hypothetical protein
MKLTQKFKTPSFLLGSALLLWLFHWPVLQGIAWVGMVVSYSKAHGFRSGWEMTFSGNYPCAVCLAIQTGVESETDLVTSLLQNPGFYSVGLLTLILLAGISAFNSFRPENDCL